MIGFFFAISIEQNKQSLKSVGEGITSTWRRTLLKMSLTELLWLFIVTTYVSIFIITAFLSSETLTTTRFYRKSGKNVCPLTRFCIVFSRPYYCVIVLTEMISSAFSKISVFTRLYVFKATRFQPTTLKTMLSHISAILKKVPVFRRLLWSFYCGQ